jgi:hypothetical protein
LRSFSSVRGHFIAWNAALEDPRSNGNVYLASFTVLTGKPGPEPS